jgi:hypothetical protein
MSTRSLWNCMTAVAMTIGLAIAPAVSAGVVVTIVDANTATAAIDLTDASSNSYHADVTITFDQAVNLSVGSLNLTASLIDPNNPPATLPRANVSVDPSFPVLISVEPPVALFMNSYEANQTGDGNLAFFNTYYFEVHTANLACSSASSPYRLYKAPHGSTTFADVSDEILSGSVRARGRGGAFSQFIMVKDTRLPLVIALQKLTDLTTRLLASTVTNGALLTTLTNLLTTVLADVVTLNIGGALSALQTFIDDVTAAAGIDIPNEWKSDRSLNNDAGELLSLAQTLRFTLTILQGPPSLCGP